MVRIRRSSQRGFFDHGWLKAYHTFSFAEFVDPEFTRYRALRVLNEDWIAPGGGFGAHPHHDMEIVTVVLYGRLQHRDSLGQNLTIGPGEVQRMTAGTGIVHSESNPSPSEPTHLYQLWFFPDRKGLAPEYEQRSYAHRKKSNALMSLVSNETSDEAVRIHQDVRLSVGQLNHGHLLKHVLRPGSACWIQVASGALFVNDAIKLEVGDAAAVEEPEVVLKGQNNTEFLFIELG